MINNVLPRDIQTILGQKPHCKSVLHKPIGEQIEKFQVVEVGRCYVYSAFVDFRFKSNGLVRVIGLMLHDDVKMGQYWCQLWYPNSTTSALEPAGVKLASKDKMAETHGR